MNKYIARTISVIAWMVAISLILIISVRFLSTTELVLNLIGNKLTATLEQELNAEVQIETISGDAWENLIFNQVQITTDEFELAINELELNYILFEVIFGEPSLEKLIITDIDLEIDIDQTLKGYSETESLEEEGDLLAFSINEIQFIGGNFDFNSKEYLPDSSILISDFNLSGDVIVGVENRLGIQDLNLKVVHGQLPDALTFGFDGEVTDQALTLNDLVFGIGESVVNGAFNVDLSSETVTGEVSSDNFNTNDILSKTQNYPDLLNVDLALSITGDFDSLEVGLTANADQLRNVEFTTGLSWDDELSITSVMLNADFFDFSEFVDLSTAAGGPVRLEMTGEFTGINENSELEWLAEVANLKIDEYPSLGFLSKGSMFNYQAQGNLEVLSSSGERLTSTFDMDSVFGESPTVRMDYFIRNINPKSFDDKLVEGRIDASGSIEGPLFSFPDSTIEFSLANQNPETGELLTWLIGDDQINEVSLNSVIGSDQLKTESFIRVKESTLNVEIQAFNPFVIESDYTFQANFENLDIGNISMFEGNNTLLTGGIYGIGRGRSAEDTDIFGTLSLSEGQINTAIIESFDATIQYQNGLLQIREGKLQSEIADGTINGQRDLMDVTNPSNNLNLSLTLKNLQPLAGLFDLSILEANGQLDGNIKQNSEGILIGDFDLSLENVLVDSVFAANEINGTTNVQIETKQSFDASLEILNPIINDLVFQDITMEMDGYLTGDSLKSDFDLTVIGSERGRLVQQGTIAKDIINELTDIQFSRFDFISQESDLLLQKPFNVRMYRSEFGTDTLILKSVEGAYLEFSVPISGVNDTHVYLSGNNFDIGLIQDIAFGERFLDGILSGEIKYNQSPQQVFGSGLARIDQLTFKGSEADSVIFSFDILNERLDTRTNVYWDNTLAVAGWANVPFVVSKERIDQSFFERPIRGELDIQPTDLSKFSTVLAELGIESTTGILSLSSEMSGAAGSPRFSGIIEVDEPQLSGIPVSRLSAEFNYANATKELIINSEIFTQNTPVAELKINYPLDYDFSLFELYLPGLYDEIEISAVTNNLNIALFNDFVDPNYISNITGVLNADLQFSGPIGNIKPKGYVNIRGGSMRVPYSGIQLRNISMQLDVDSTKLDISRFYAESGRGRLFSSGTADLDGITPKDVSMIVDANLFEMAKTRDMNIVVDLNADLTGDVSNPLLDGNVIVRRGFYMLSNFGDEAIEEVILDDEEIASFSPYDSLSIDLDIGFRRDFFVRSRDFLDLEVEPKGSLNIVKKKAGEPQVFGVLDVDDGYIRPLGKLFTVEDGAITFIGDYENPDLDIRSSYIPQTRQKRESVVLYYIIGGTKNEPEFTFESEPFMEQQDVICYTLFNKPCYDLESWQSVFAEGSNAQAFQALTDVLLDQVETIASRQLGVDVVQIDNSGQNGRTAITTGWYLNQRTFFSIINELTSSTPKTLFVLEYLLNENWDLIITQGDDARQGVDVRYQFDY